MFKPTKTRVNKKFVPLPQTRFPKGYISILTDSRIPPDGLAEMYNMTLEQDSIPRPRPPFKLYSSNSFLGTCIGIGTYTQWVNGLPVKYEISMQVIGGVSKLCTRKDGGAWSQISGSYTFDTHAWCTFTQGAQLTTSDTQDNRVYISNGVNNMSYYDINSGTVVVYTGLNTPSAPTLAASGSLTGSNFNQYYRISANNQGGESAASASASVAISTDRDFWTSGQNVTVSWTAVPGASSYNIYTSNVSGQEEYLTTVNGTSFIDSGTMALNPFKIAPNNDSSAGPLLTNMVNIDNQLYGCGDPTNPQYLWYSGQGQHFGDFSFNPLGGGYVGIDYGGTTQPTTPFPFHDGKGNPAPSVLTHGAAGRGKLYHIQFTSETIGTTVLVIPNVYEASSQDGCPSPRGVAIYNQNAYYCTGTAFKTTGTKPNVINILATDTISNQILPDVQNLNLAQLPNYVCQEYLGKIYFAMPTSASSANNEIWVLDLTRGGLWILRWVLGDGSSTQHMWLYEDNSGSTHFLILTSNNQVFELDLLRTTTPTQDNGNTFNTVLRSGALTFDAGGVAEVSSYFSYFKLLYPQGLLNVNIYGLKEDGTNALIVTEPVNETAATSPFIWGQMLFSNPDGSSVFSGDTGSFSGNQPGKISGTTQSSVTVPVEVDEIVSELRWEITTASQGCDYLASSITNTVYTIPRRYAGSS